MRNSRFAWKSYPMVVFTTEPFRFVQCAVPKVSQRLVHEVRRDSRFNCSVFASTVHMADAPLAVGGACALAGITQRQGVRQKEDIRATHSAGHSQSERRWVVRSGEPPERRGGKQINDHLRDGACGERVVRASTDERRADPGLVLPRHGEPLT